MTLLCEHDMFRNMCTLCLSAEVESKNEQFQQYARKMEAEMNAQADEIERLHAENFSLAAWQCEFTDGKTGLVAHEHGGTYCAMARENERLRYSLKRMLLEFDFMIERGVITDVRNDVIFVEARAALEGKIMVDGYDVYAAAREEYRKKITEQAAEIEWLRAVLYDIYLTTRCDKTAVKARAALNPAKD